MSQTQTTPNGQNLFSYQPQVASSFTQEVIAASEQKLLACYQCRRCAAGCPVSDSTDLITPDRLIRMVTMGDKENALNNQLIWRCVACNTCGTRCPNNIRTSRIVIVLRKMAIAEGIVPLRPEVNNFHCAIFNESLRWGRVQELGVMSEFEARNTLDSIKGNTMSSLVTDIKAHSKMAWQMIKQKRLHLNFIVPSVKGRNEINRLLKKSEKHYPYDNTPDNK